MITLGVLMCTLYFSLHYAFGLCFLGHSSIHPVLVIGPDFT